MLLLPRRDAHLVVGTLVLMDRGGHPTINPFINPDGEKNLYNSRHPADDVANYLGPWSQILENGGYTPDEAKAAALQVLPDILRYDRTKPATYPNGRILTDDVYSARFGSPVRVLARKPGSSLAAGPRAPDHPAARLGLLCRPVQPRAAGMDDQHG